VEPNELLVAGMIAQGLTNEQIAGRLGFRDKRTISRTNGSIYAAWGWTRTQPMKKSPAPGQPSFIKRTDHPLG
jgi:hypothetical protein